jgi:DNA-binding response OmpR family regulator
MDKLKDNEANAEGIPVILVVDDDPDYRYMITLGLRGDFQVLEAANGIVGMDMAREHLPDLVVTDLMMPGMDGIELCRQLKTHVETSHIPVIMLTAKTSVESQVEGLEMGADDYVTKPFNQLLLKTRIQNLLQSRQLLRERFSRGLVAANPSDVESSPDHEFLKKTFSVLEEQYQDPEFTVELFAVEMNMSLRTLHRKLKALTDETPSKLIWNIRLEKAAALLLSTDLRISDVAYNVGYTESSHFSRQFRQHFGMTPSEYRSAQ